MGYNTDYDLTIETETIKVDFEAEVQIIMDMELSEEEKKSEISEICNIDSDSILRDFILNYHNSHDLKPDGSAMGCRWYNHEKEIIPISKKYSEALFILDGVGEEYPDIWRKYFKDGEMYKETAQIVFNKFNIKKLKPSCK